MKTKLILAGSVALCLCSCDRSNPPGKQAGADASGTITRRESAAGDEERGTSWELLDKSGLKAETAPWPPVAGPVTLKVQVTPNAEGRKFAGSVTCRVAASKRSSAAWQPMQKVREDSSGSVYFDVPLILVRGPAYIQFRVRGAGEKAFNKEFIDLTDWKVEVQ